MTNLLSTLLAHFQQNTVTLSLFKLNDMKLTTRQPSLGQLIVFVNQFFYKVP